MSKESFVKSAFWATTRRLTAIGFPFRLAKQRTVLAPHRARSAAMTMTAGELFCNTTDVRYSDYYLSVDGNSGPSTDYASRHCASEHWLW